MHLRSKLGIYRILWILNFLCTRGTCYRSEICEYQGLPGRTMQAACSGLIYSDRSRLYQHQHILSPFLLSVVSTTKMAIDQRCCCCCIQIRMSWLHCLFFNPYTYWGLKYYLVIFRGGSFLAHSNKNKKQNEKHFLSQSMRNLFLSGMLFPKFLY